MRWVPQRVVNGVPYDTPILGYRNNTANTLRLWRAEAPESFDFAVFNRGDYYGAVNAEGRVGEPQQGALPERRSRCRARSCGSSSSTSSCRARCRTCCASCAVQTIPLERFHEKFAVQLNDTHPAIAVAELMRLLVDEHGMRLGRGVEHHARRPSPTPITRCCPRRWRLAAARCSARLLPRHLEIIYEINARFLDEVRLRFFGDDARIARLSLIDESGERYVRMANLACVGSHAINGVAELHSELLKQDVLRDFHELWPEKFRNKTNGVTPRRWIALAQSRASPR